MTRDRDVEPADIVWEVGASRDDFSPEYVERRDAFADAARSADWDTVLRLLVDEPSWVNAVRIGSTSGYTTLHQAAWHGADQKIVQQLLDAGAWCTLRTTDGSRAVDVAASHDHHELAGLLTPQIDDAPYPDALADIETYLHALIMVRTRPLGDRRTFRLPQVELLLELPGGRSLWCPIPGMYGGFALRWDGEAVVAESWSRVVGGSGRRHRITPESIELVESGFC